MSLPPGTGQLLIAAGTRLAILGNRTGSRESLQAPILLSQQDSIDSTGHTLANH